MFELYPDILVKMPSGGLSRDEYGNYTAPDGSSAEHCICRAVRTARGRPLTSKAGRSTVTIMWCICRLVPFR